MNDDSIKVSVVIPTYNRPDAALHCARSVLASDFKDPIEIIIVDDCSKNCMVADVVKRELPDVPNLRVIRHDRNLNTAAAHNTGAREATGEYVFFIDDDNELSPDTIRKMLDVFAGGGGYGLVAPLAVNVTPSGEKTVWAKSFAFSKWTSIPRNPDANVDYTEDYRRQMMGKTIETWYSPNAYMLPRSLYVQLGGIDPWYGMYMEESDLGVRVLKAGYKACIVGDAVTWHRHYNDAGDPIMRRFATNTPRKAFLMSRNRLHFAWRHYSLLQILSILFVFAPVITARYFFMALFRGWPKIGVAFVVGYLVGWVQVVGLMLTSMITRPFAIIGKLINEAVAKPCERGVSPR